MELAQVLVVSGRLIRASRRKAVASGAEIGVVHGPYGARPRVSSAFRRYDCAGKLSPSKNHQPVRRNQNSEALPRYSDRRSRELGDPNWSEFLPMGKFPLQHSSSSLPISPALALVNHGG